MRGEELGGFVDLFAGFDALALTLALPASLVGPCDLAPFSRAIRARSSLDICFSFLG